MSFAKKYKEDEKFRAKHKAFMAEKVECECGAITARFNMSKHRKSGKHQRFIEEKEKEKEKNERIEEINETITELFEYFSEEIDKLKEDIKKKQKK